ncbi:MAG TPA: hypothetical protein VIG33_11010 [Pseudobdellovibrionaceae bacterium]|jgi:hypothetical protein
MNSKLRDSSGMSILEILICIGLLSVFIVMSLIFSDSLNHSTQLGRTMATRDRISSGVRSIAGMPAALRNAMRAAQVDGVTPFNVNFNNCVAGTQANACVNNQEYPLALFSPTVAMDAAGSLLGLLQITSAVGVVATNRFDSFGVPCVQTNPDCLFVVHTSFRAQCPPATLSATAPASSDPAYIPLLIPMATCTVAEAVNVFFSVEVDPAALAANPGLSVFSAPITGSVATSVKLIFGNDPW